LNLCWKMLDLQHQYNNYTTIPHMRVGFTYWGPPLCEGLLYSCYIGVVQESNLIFVTTVQEISVVQIVHSKLRLTSKTTVLLSSPLFKKARIHPSSILKWPNRPLLFHWPNYPYNITFEHVVMLMRRLYLISL
jgi:hypothetical protein